MVNNKTILYAKTAVLPREETELGGELPYRREYLERRYKARHIETRSSENITKTAD